MQCIQVNPNWSKGFLRKGAALNAVQIAEAMVNRKLIVPKQKAA